MASIVHQYEAAQLEPASEWRLSGTSLVRRLRGVELLLKASEQFNDGNVSV